MRQFTISFEFESRSHLANVTEIGGLDHVQYAISQNEEDLAERFRTSVIKKLTDEEEFQYSYPPGPGGQEFMESLVKGLEKYLHSPS